MMGMAIDPRRIEVIDDQTALRLRRLSGAQRVAMGLEMVGFACAVIERNVRATHPEWNEGRITAEVLRRFAGE